jgi:hypothetical protein
MHITESAAAATDIQSAPPKWRAFQMRDPDNSISPALNG